MNATIELLDKEGEHGLRIDDVKNRTGISIGSIYHHFGDREGLISAARSRQLRASHPAYGAKILELAASSNSARTFADALGAVIRDVHSPERSDERAKRIVYVASAMGRPDLLKELRKQQTALIDAGEQVAQVLADRGWLKPNVPARAVVSLTLALEFGAIVADLDDKRVDETQWCGAIQNAIESLLELDSST